MSIQVKNKKQKKVRYQILLVKIHTLLSPLVLNHGYMSVVRSGSIAFLSTYIPEK